MNNFEIAILLQLQLTIKINISVILLEIFKIDE